jgi:hypothetical protein
LPFLFFVRRVKNEGKSINTAEDQVLDLGYELLLVEKMLPSKSADPAASEDAASRLASMKPSIFSIQLIRTKSHAIEHGPLATSS